ncbi:MAG: hypothetical protein ABI406_08760, partial [Ktedonobacteraceae bacterium]
IASGESSDNKTIRIWEVDTGKTRSICQEHSYEINSPVSHPNGTYIDMSDWNIQLGNISTSSEFDWVHEEFAECFNETDTKYMSNTIAWSPDGKYIVSSGDGFSTYVWNTSTLESVFKHENYYEDFTYVLAWSPNGVYIAEGASIGNVFVRNTATWEIISIYNSQNGKIHDLTWSPDSRHMAIADNDGMVHIWDTVKEKNILIYNGHSSAVSIVKWSPDGTQIVSAERKGLVHIWSPFKEDDAFTYINKNGEFVLNYDYAKDQYRKKDEYQYDDRDIDAMVEAQTMNHQRYMEGDYNDTYYAPEEQDIDEEIDESDWVESYEEVDADDVMSDEYDDNYNQYYERDIGDEIEEYFENLNDEMMFGEVD